MKMQDFTCKYSRHQCELKPKHIETERFKRMFMISEKNFWSFWFLRCRGAIELEYNRQKISKNWWIVHPFSLLRLFWEFFMILVSISTFLTYLLKLGFLNPLLAKYYRIKSRYNSLNAVVNAVVLDYYITLVWWIDSLGNFFTGYYNPETGKVVMDLKMIAKNYAVPWFIIDAATSIPIDFLVLKASGLNRYSNLEYYYFILLELYNMFRFLRLRTYIKYLLRITKSNCFTRWILRFLCSIILYAIFTLIICTLSMAIPEMIAGEKLFYKNYSSLSWAKNSSPIDKELVGQVGMALFFASHHVTGMSFPVRDDFSVEDYVVAMISCIAGRFFWIYSFVHILEALTASQALTVKFLMISLHCKEYLKQKDVPAVLKKRINRFYLYRFQAHFCRNKTILKHLTKSLRKQISLYTCHRLIHNTEVFQSLPRKVLANLGQKMNREMYFPNDVIIQGNTYGECVYFICSGTVAVTTISGKEICLLHDGEFFGEIALIFQDRRRIATVTAVTITEVYRLESSDYKKIIEVYPDVYYRLEKLALERYKTTFLIEGGRKPQEL